MTDTIGHPLTSPYTRDQLDKYRAQIEEARAAAAAMEQGRPVDPKYSRYNAALIMAHVNAESRGLELVEKGLDTIRDANRVSITVDNSSYDIQPAGSDDASTQLVRDVVDQASLSGGAVLSKVFGLAQFELGFKAIETTKPGDTKRTFELVRPSIQPLSIVRRALRTLRTLRLSRE